MWSELPKLLGRDFAVGYFLPFAAFLVASIGLLTAFGIHSSWLNGWENNLLVGATIAGLISWLGGTLLVALNRSIIRLFEGYGSKNPFLLKKKLQVKAFNNLLTEIRDLEDQQNQYEAKKEKFPSELEDKYIRLRRREANSFPDQEDLLLPTAFGNTIRAFERYPSVLYGLAGVLGWDRLVAVIPKDFRLMIDSMKTQLDFWVNLWLLAIVFLVEYVCVGLYSGIVLQNWHFETGWIPILGILVLCVTVLMSRKAAEEWGDSVKSAFDVFLPKLRSEMGYAARANIQEERALWSKLSQAIQYRSPSALPDRNVTPAALQVGQATPSQNGPTPPQATQATPEQIELTADGDHAEQADDDEDGKTDS